MQHTFRNTPQNEDSSHCSSLWGIRNVTTMIRCQNANRFARARTSAFDCPPIDSEARPLEVHQRGDDDRGFNPKDRAPGIQQPSKHSTNPVPLSVRLETESTAIHQTNTYFFSLILQNTLYNWLSLSTRSNRSPFSTTADCCSESSSVSLASLPPFPAGAAPSLSSHRLKRAVPRCAVDTCAPLASPLEAFAAAPVLVGCFPSERATAQYHHHQIEESARASKAIRAHVRCC